MSAIVQPSWACLKHNGSRSLYSATDSQRSPRVKRWQRWKKRRLWSQLLITSLTQCANWTTARSSEPNCTSENVSTLCCIFSCVSMLTICLQCISHWFRCSHCIPMFRSIIVSTADKCFLFRVTVRELQAYVFADTWKRMKEEGLCVVTDNNQKQNGKVQRPLSTRLPVCEYMNEHRKKNLMASASERCLRSVTQSGQSTLPLVSTCSSWDSYALSVFWSGTAMSSDITAQFLQLLIQRFRKHSQSYHLQQQLNALRINGGYLSYSIVFSKVPRNNLKLCSKSFFQNSRYITAQRA